MSHAVAEQNRHQMNNDLVEQVGTKALRRQVGPKDDDSLARCCVLGSRDRIGQLGLK
jgi:hypothetical protein